jgi:hypothetical protein
MSITRRNSFRVICDQCGDETAWIHQDENDHFAPVSPGSGWILGYNITGSRHLEIQKDFCSLNCLIKGVTDQFKKE